MNYNRRDQTVYMNNILRREKFKDKSKFYDESAIKHRGVETSVVS